MGVLQVRRQDQVAQDGVERGGIAAATGTSDRTSRHAIVGERRSASARRRQMHRQHRREARDRARESACPRQHFAMAYCGFSRRNSTAGTLEYLHQLTRSSPHRAPVKREKRGIVGAIRRVRGRHDRRRTRRRWATASETMIADSGRCPAAAAGANGSSRCSAP